MGIKIETLALWVIGLPIALVIAAFVILLIYSVYSISHSKSTVSEFCNKIQVNDSFDALLEKAKESGISVQRGNEFYVKGFGMHYSSCGVQQLNDKITSKKFVPDNG